MGVEQKGVCTLKELMYLKREVKAYEKDPSHKITPHHVSLRQKCVVMYGGEVVRAVIKEVYEELFRERANLSVALPEPCVSKPSLRSNGHTRKEKRRKDRRERKTEMKRVRLNFGR